MDDKEKVAAVDTEERVPTKKAAQYTGPVIYIGPGFRDSRLNHCMIFAGGIPSPEADDEILKHLFVPPSELNQALTELRTKGTALHTFYRAAVDRRGGK
ncbi:hypothetical protein [uncultured Megasphaera sp.]|uniref:hypothetical protein n=1 Tax=uncultured Megasphaera sp. TaxID=165188 RepID=UPI0025E907CB|nr:hypothetical protein [uncultured Megasphaera sp.]